MATGGKPLIWFHAGISTLVLALYVAMFALGRQMIAEPVPVPQSGAAALRGADAGPRHLHRNLGMAFCAMRLLNYATAFLVGS